MDKIGFNKPYLTGNEISYINEVFISGKLSGNGKFTRMCQDWFCYKYGFKKCLLTTSCTDALEMAAILIDIKPGDEIILPSYTFVSTANPFLLRGAKLVFVDSREDHPGMDESSIESLITSNTKAIVAVHYGGVACDMDLIMDIATRHQLLVIEDAAQAIDGYYIGNDGVMRALGSIGHLAAFSFHETKNIISGEGGMLVINDIRFVNRAEIIWEKGTNRSSFYRGEIDKYGWVDIGSSFLPSEIIASILWAQLEQIHDIQKTRMNIWSNYYKNLSNRLHKIYCRGPIIPHYSTNNAHMFYIVCNNIETRTKIIEKLKMNNINAVFHYLSLHSSPFFLDKHDGRILVNSEFYSNCLLRLPFFYGLKNEDQLLIANIIINEI